jgi:integrase/recombinase XerD
MRYPELPVVELELLDSSKPYSPPWRVHEGKGKSRRLSKRGSQEAIDLRWAVVEEFLEAAKLAANSKTAYRRELTKFLNWTDCRWVEMKPSLITQYKTHLNESGLATSSVNRAIATLKAFFKWLKEAHPEKGVPDNITTGVKFNALVQPEPGDLPEDVIGAIEQAIATEENETLLLRDTTLFQVLLHGLRASEVSKLNVSDYDGKRLLVKGAKGGNTLTKPLLGKACSAIDTYLQHRHKQLKESLEASSPLFIIHGRRGKGERLGYKGIYATVKKWVEKAKLESDIHPHNFRHTYCTGLLLGGIDPQHARRLSGHRSEAAFRRYANRVEDLAAEEAFYRAFNEEL